jgi:hypothetical protein
MRVPRRETAAAAQMRAAPLQLRRIFGAIKARRSTIDV